MGLKAPIAFSELANLLRALWVTVFMNVRIFHVRRGLSRPIALTDEPFQYVVGLQGPMLFHEYANRHLCAYE